MNEPVPQSGGEAEWLDRCRAGDPGALAALYERHVDRVYRLVRRLVGDPARAEDVVHDVFVKVFEGIGRFEGRSNLETWIRRIAVHAAIDVRRARAPVTGEDLDSIPERRTVDPGDRLAQGELGLLLEEALACLSDRLRECLVLRETEGLSYQEIADALGTNVGTVMSRLHRARQEVRQFLKKHGILGPRSRLEDG
ncbi:MAG: sigma-70 family RNA polymerase sigma factor [Planctomycetes bacterium]|nr:sigma-70 family RNA polymerase sigma factor [Planctomycetota bacterium]